MNRRHIAIAALVFSAAAGVWIASRDETPVPSPALASPAPSQLDSPLPVADAPAPVIAESGTFIVPPTGVLVGRPGRVPANLPRGPHDEPPESVPVSPQPARQPLPPWTKLVENPQLPVPPEPEQPTPFSK